MIFQRWLTQEERGSMKKINIESLAEPGEVIPWYAYLANELAPVTNEDIEWANKLQESE